MTSRDVERGPQHPRVLLVTMSRVHDVDQNGVSIRNWFGGWPRESLAQIYSGGEVESPPFCSRTYRISGNERRLGWIFDSVKRLAQPPGGMQPRTRDYWGHPVMRVRRSRVAAAFIRQGVWELAFRPQLSRALREWIAEFRPDIVYAQGYSLAFCWLPLLIAREFNLPLCFHTGDDWPAALYARSKLQPLMSGTVKAAARRLIGASAVRLSNGPQMAEEYHRRYGVPFEALMMCDSAERFEACPAKRLAPVDVATFVYSGNLGHGRWESLLELCTALRRIEDRGEMRSRVFAFVPHIPAEASAALEGTSNLQLLPPVDHEELPAILRGADVLFLPETFDPIEAREIRLSVSTKAHLYMMSNRPILVYGSEDAGVVRYACEGWALVVSRRDTHCLGQAALSLLQDGELRARLLARAADVAARNHAQEIVRSRLLQLLAEAVAGATQRTEPGLVGR